MNDTRFSATQIVIMVVIVALASWLLQVSAEAADPPPGWYQVNVDGFDPAFGPSGDEISLFVFDGELYAFNDHGLFRMNDPIAKIWTQLNIPDPPNGPGNEPYIFQPFDGYLYAFYKDQLWWIKEGENPTGPWTKVTSTGLPGGVSPWPWTMFDGQIYGNYYPTQATFEIWRTKDIGKGQATWERVVMNSFGDPTNNQGVNIMTVFNNKIYAGIMTLIGLFGDPTGYGTGVEIWESSTGDAGTWTQVNVDGFGTTFPGCINPGQPGQVCNFPIHQVIGSAGVYKAPGETQEYLYIGTKSHFGAEVWRYDGTGVNGWVNVTPSWAGPCLFGCGPGRNEDMAVFQGELYLAEGFPTANLGKYDGTTWSVILEGPPPYSTVITRRESLSNHNGRLYVTVRITATGDQVWGFPFTAPVAVCTDVTVDADETCKGSASIDGGSYDPDGDPITLTQTPPGPYDLGSTIVTLTVTDSFGLSDSCTGTVTVNDTQSPTIDNLAASPDTLWPPNHKMVSVTVAVDASDNCDAQPMCQITSVRSNETANGSGDGNTASDWEITGDLTVKLRAERSGSGSGRIYTIDVDCTDAYGNSSTDSVTVTVPHDYGKKKGKK